MKDIIIYSFISTFLVGIIVFNIGIPVLKKINIKQAIRVEGPKSHKKKAGTPTMGGLLIIITTLIGVLLTYYVFSFKYKIMLLLLFPLLTFGLIGFIDDYLVSIKNNNKGLSGRLRLFIEVILSATFFNIYMNLGFPTSINIFNHYKIETTWVYGMLILGILVSSANAVNLTDGLDGLAGGLIVIALISLCIVSYYKEFYNVVIFCGILIGALSSFLIFNKNPAQIFMGDTGSLSLGSTLGSISIVIGSEIIFIIICFVFVLETLSVIIQVIYFKKTKGKRVFKMTPLHHHYELSGYSEKHVVKLFYIWGIFFGLVGTILGVYFNW